MVFQKRNGITLAICINDRHRNALKKGGKKISVRMPWLLALAFMVLATLDPLAVGVQGSNSQEITYPVKIFEGGKAQFFRYKMDDGIVIQYFIIKSSDGVIRAALDACDVCWPAGKGYEQKGDFMVCRNCGQRFASTRINEVKGGCNPHPLRRRLAQDRVVVMVPDIAEGKRLFDFSKKGAK